MSTFAKKSTNQLVVESVLELTKKELEDIRTNLKLSSDVEILNEKNSALIGGLRIRYQGKIVDLSLKSALDKLKETNNG